MPADRASQAALRVCVVGGGVSGLVIARDLALGGTRVTLLERDPELGGRIRPAELDGVGVDIGAESFATRGGGVARLLRELGLEADVVRPAPLGSWLVSAEGGAQHGSGRVHATRLPAAGTLGVPAAPLSRDVRRALGIPGALRAALDRLLPGAVGRGSATLAELVRARMGARVLDRFVRPVALGVYSAPPERLPLTAVPALAEAYGSRGSLVTAARSLRDGSSAAGGAVAGLRGGMSRLVVALAEDAERRGAEIQTGVAAAGIAREPAGEISVRGTDDRELVRADAVVLAVPESAANVILGEAGAQGPVESRVEIVALALDASHESVRPLDLAPRGTGALVTDGAETTVLAKALTHVSRKWPEAGHAAAGRHVLRLSYGRAGREPATAGLDDAAVRRIALRDASLVLGVDLSDSAVKDMSRRIWAMPVRDAGGARPTPPADVHLAGDWVSGTGLASVVPGARETAERILDAHHERTRT